MITQILGLNGKIEKISKNLTFFTKILQRLEIEGIYQYIRWATQILKARTRAMLQSVLFTALVSLVIIREFRDNLARV